MSIPAVVRDIELLGNQIFDHTPIVRNEIEKFVERFERNERHKEFDGILRASHALEEATSAPVEALFEIGKMKHITESVNALTERIKGLTTPTYQQEHDDYLAEVSQAQKAYVDLCRTEAQKKMRSAVNANRT